MNLTSIKWSSSDSSQRVNSEASFHWIVLPLRLGPCHPHAPKARHPLPVWQLLETRLNLWILSENYIDFRWPNKEPKIEITLSNLLFKTTQMFQHARSSFMRTYCINRFISYFFLISFSGVWISFSWRIWVWWISSLVALIISSWILIIKIVVEMW